MYIYVYIYILYEYICTHIYINPFPTPGTGGRCRTTAPCETSTPKHPTLNPKR